MKPLEKFGKTSTDQRLEQLSTGQKLAGGILSIRRTLLFVVVGSAAVQSPKTQQQISDSNWQNLETVELWLRMLVLTILVQQRFLKSWVKYLLR